MTRQVFCMIEFHDFFWRKSFYAPSDNEHLPHCYKKMREARTD